MHVAAINRRRFPTLSTHMPISGDTGTDMRYGIINNRPALSSENPYLTDMNLLPLSRKGVYTASTSVQMRTKIQNVDLKFLISSNFTTSDSSSTSSRSPWAPPSLNVTKSDSFRLSAFSAFLSKITRKIEEKKENAQSNTLTNSGSVIDPVLFYRNGDRKLLSALPISGMVMIIPIAVASSLPLNHKLTMEVCEVMRLSQATPNTALPTSIIQNDLSYPPKATIACPTITKNEKVTQPNLTPI